MFLRGALGRSGRKRATRAARFLGGQSGFLNASTLMAAVGVAWGVYESLRSGAEASTSLLPGPAPAGGPPAPATSAVMLPAHVARVVRLAASAANADGQLTDGERDVVLARAREAGVADAVARELHSPGSLADIVAGVSADSDRRDLYVLAFTVIRADAEVSGAERIYLAQLAHALGLDAATASALEQQTAASIDGAIEPEPGRMT